MPLETALAFLKSAGAGKPIAPTIVIFGPHAFLREAVLGTALTRLLESGYQHRSFNIATEIDFDRALDELRAPDLFAAKRVVVCRVPKSHRDRAEDDAGGDASAGSGAATGGSAGARGGETGLMAAVEGAEATNHLVILYERDNAPAKMRRAAEKSALMVSCNRPYDNQIPEYAEAIARTMKLKLAGGAAEILAARHGADLAAIANELDKASILIGADRQISVSDLNDPGARRMPEVFEIAENFARGRASTVLAQIDRAVGLGRDPIEILAVEIIPVMRRMMIAKAMIARRCNAGEIAAALGLSPASPIARRAIEGARHFEQRSLTRAYRRAAELDAGFKNGTNKNREAALGALILELMRARGAEQI